jgi:hypothetical protein
MFGGLLKKMRGLLGSGGTSVDAGGVTAPKRGILSGVLNRPELGPGGTAGFNPAAADSLPKLGRSMGGDSGLGNRPQPMQNQMPMLQRPESPVLKPIRDSVNIQGQSSPGLGIYEPEERNGAYIPLRPINEAPVNPSPVGGGDALGSLMDRMANRPAEVENQQAQMLAQRPIGEVRPPDFLGRKGATMEDTPMNHERYGYQTEYMKDGKIPRRPQDILANALHGAAQGFQGGGGWEGALGGAGAGAIGSAVSPIHARDFRFNKEQMPRLQAQQQEKQQIEDRRLGQRGKLAGIEHTEAQTRRINEPTPPPGYADAGWGTYNRSTGKPEYIRPGGVSPTAAPRRYRVGDDLVDETGKVVYKGRPRPSAEQRPVTVSPGSTVIDPKTGREIYKAAPKETPMPKEARDAQSYVSQMKQDAISAWNLAKRETDPVKRAELEQDARDAQEEFNNATINLADDYPDFFESGEGEGGWNYAKPKGSTPTIKRGSGGDKAGGTAKLSDLKKLLQ